MQFSKFMPLVCAAVFCAGFISIRADDNPAQAAARAALEQKMQELDIQEASSNAQATAAAAQPAPASVPAETPQPPAIVVTSSGATEEQPASPAAGTTSPGIDEQAIVRAALDKKMRELDAQEAAQQAAQQSSTNAETPPVTAVAPEQPKPAETQPVQTAPVQIPVATAPPPTIADYPGKELGLKPIEPPASPVSADKEAQLQALLAKYMADQVSPEEYQKQRAAILAAP
jgi:hypothetical protein